MYNYKHTDIQCPECQAPTVEDNHHDEIFCTHCGLVILDSTIPRITMLIREHSKIEDTNTIDNFFIKHAKNSD